VAADELLHRGAHDVLELEGPGRGLGDLGVEDDVEEEVSELAPEVVPVLALDGVHSLVGLLDEEVADGGVGLLAVPGALPPEAADDRDVVGEEVGGGLGAVGVGEA
jgi:hypothetical protein